MPVAAARSVLLALRDAFGAAGAVAVALSHPPLFAATTGPAVREVLAELQLLCGGREAAVEVAALDPGPAGTLCERMPPLWGYSILTWGVSSRF